MKMQTEKCPSLALEYVSDDVVTTHTFITNVLLFICADKHLRRELLPALMEGPTQRYLKALDHTGLLLDVESKG